MVGLQRQMGRNAAENHRSCVQASEFPLFWLCVWLFHVFCANFEVFCANFYVFCANFCLCNVFGEHLCLLTLVPVVHHVVWLRHNNRRVPQRAMPGEFTHTRADHIDSDHFNNDWALRGPLSLSAAMPASEPAFGAAQESLSCGGYALFEQRLPECSDV